MSVARTAAFLSLTVAAAGIASGVVVWWIARGVGILTGLEDLVASGLGLSSWTLPTRTLFVLWSAVLLVIALLAVLFVSVLTVAYNRLNENSGVVVLGDIESPGESV